MPMMALEWLSHPAELADRTLTGGLDGGGLVVVVGLALLLGLRHAADPDHLVAVTALISSHDADGRDVVRVGAWWGLGHGLVLIAVGVPLVLLRSGLPAWVEPTAERLVGAVIVALGVRVLVRWWQRTRIPAHHLLTGAHHAGTRRTARQAVAIGALHGLGGTGAIVLLFATTLPSAGQAALALAVFAPASTVSMTVCTGVYGHLLRRRLPGAMYDRVGMPVLALVSITFGAWYAGVL